MFSQKYIKNHNFGFYFYRRKNKKNAHTQNLHIVIAQYFFEK